MSLECRSDSDLFCVRCGEGLCGKEKFKKALAEIHHDTPSDTNHLKTDSLRYVMLVQGKIWRNCAGCHASRASPRCRGPRAPVKWEIVLHHESKPRRWLTQRIRLGRRPPRAARCPEKDLLLEESCSSWICLSFRWKRFPARNYHQYIDYKEGHGFCMFRFV